MSTTAVIQTKATLGPPTQVVVAVAKDMAAEKETIPSSRQKFRHKSNTKMTTMLNFFSITLII